MRLSLSLLPLLSALAAVPAQDKHLLRLNLPENKPVFFVHTSDMTMNMNMGEQAMTTTMVMQFFTEQKVVASLDGVCSVEQKVYRMTIKTRSPAMAAVDYDSDRPGADAGMFADMAKLVGKTVRMKVDARGRVSDIVLPEGAGSGAQKPEDLRQMFGESFPEFPEEPVAVGGTWKTTTKKPAGQMGDMDVEITHKLAGVDQGKATIEQAMKIDGSKLQMPDGMKMSIGEAKGSSVVDLATGRFADMNSVLAMDMQGEQGGMKMKVGMAMKSAVKPTEPPAPKAKAEPAKADAGTGK